jgi:hypothetical protein
MQNIVAGLILAPKARQTGPKAAFFLLALGAISVARLAGPAATGAAAARGGEDVGLLL